MEVLAAVDDHRLAGDEVGRGGAEKHDGADDVLGHLVALDRARCRNWVQERFSVARMVDSYERLYKMAASGRPGRKLKTKPSNAR